MKPWLLKTFLFLAVFLTLSPSVPAQTNIYRTLETPFYDPNVSSDNCGLSLTVTSTLPATVPEPHRTLFTKAAARFQVNPQYLTALFLSENSNEWRPFNTKWATSPAGAGGPFQFMQGTFDGYAVDGNNDGVIDRNNIYDAAYSAANMLSKATGLNTPLGSLNTPFKPGTFLYFGAVYNWGGGNVQIKTTPSTPLNAGQVPSETQNYLKNLYALISSGFTKGSVQNGDPRVAKGAGNGGSPVEGNDCSSGVVAGSIVKTALNFAWPGPRTPKTEPKPEYRNAPPTVESAGSCYGADCGVFVSTVMRRSGADPSYPVSGTFAQEDYVRRSPQKYSVLQLGPSNTTNDLLPGDILIVNAGGGAGANGHTYIFVGKQSSGYNEASASWSSDCNNSRMPSLGTAEILDSLGRGYYLRARLK